MADSLKIKEKVKERYATVALTGDSCCSPSAGVGEAGTGGGCCTESNILQPLQSPEQVSELVGYDTKELESIPEASILGAGCGTPTKFAYIKEGDTVVDLGSGAGIDVFLAANIAKGSGRVIGIDMTDGIGRMVISDLVTDKQIADDATSIDPDKWCDCIDGALTKENYIASIKKGGFDDVEVLDEKLFKDGDQVDNRKISSIVIKAVKE